jgi:GT2 family glycosyltransferase
VSASRGNRHFIAKGETVSPHEAGLALAPLPSEPLVSIIIPTLNGGLLLQQAIASVLAQDYPRVELLVIDDGSTDDTREVLASYGGRFWWDSQPNAGQSVTLNRGVQRAAGDVIGYLSADDLLAPGAVTAAVDALRARPDAVMSYCDFATMDSDSRETWVYPMPSCADLAFIVRKGFSPFGPGSFLRREAALATPWDPALARVPDFDHSLRLARLGPFVHVPQVLAWFRVHEQSISFAAPRAEVTEEAIRVIERFYATHDLPADIVALKSEARAMANVSSAQGHLRARRWSRGLRCCGRALRLHPGLLRTPFFYQLVLSGLVGQFLHRRRSRRVAEIAAAQEDTPT